MEAQSASGTADHVLLSAARIAAYVARGRVPPGRELFTLSAAIVEAARQQDGQALDIGLDSSGTLLDALPCDGKWEACRGHLNATMQFAWLLRRANRGDL